MAGRHTGILELPYDAAGAITKFRFVTLDADEAVAQCDTAGEVTVGVFQVDVSADEATNGKGGAVQALGVSFVESGDAITRFDDVTTDADGRAITAASGNRVHGQALKAASAAGEWVPVLLNLNSLIVA